MHHREQGLVQVTDGLDAIGVVQLQLRARLAQSRSVLRGCNDGNVQHLAWGGGRSAPLAGSMGWVTDWLSAASVLSRGPWETHGWRDGIFPAGRRCCSVMRRSLGGGGRSAGRGGIQECGVR